LNIFPATFWLIVVCPRPAYAFVTVACPRRCVFANLLIVVAACAASTASCLSLTMMGGGDAISAPDAPAKKECDRGASGASLPILHPPHSLSSLMFNILLLICNILNITLEKDLKLRRCSCHRFRRNCCHNRRCRQCCRQPAVAMVRAGNGGGNRGSGGGTQQLTNRWQ
jgi:hypothetical protein